MEVKENTPEKASESDEKEKGEIGKVIGKGYKLTKKLGSGAFGEIYLAIHEESKDEYAIKLEPKKTRHSQLLAEAKLYQYFSKVPPPIPPNPHHPRTSSSFSRVSLESTTTFPKEITTL